ncbi:MAG: trehalase family glycosidase [Hyphomicrobiales bacterium]|nr:trehalase family glycosidase [Hyphomicrobiales bacterium]
MNKRLNEKAVAILKKNDRGGFTIPTARLYPFQWNWDSSFTALGLTTYDPDRAWRELEMLVGGQCSDGMIPSIIFRSDDQDYFPGPKIWQNDNGPVSCTGISQPPVLASVMLSLTDPVDADSCERAMALFDPVMRWHRWFHLFRRTEDAPAICTVHPWETGRDNCPDWNTALAGMEVDSELPSYVRKDIEHADASQRPSQLEYDKYLTIVKFGREHGWNQDTLLKDGPLQVADPGLHFILLRANRDLLKLAHILEREDACADIECWIRAGEAAVNYLWNDEMRAFCARDVRTGIFSNGFSSASALVFYAGAGTQEQRQHTLEHIRRIGDKTRFGQPSWDPDAAGFESQRYWCGPLWCQMNYMIARGLAENGEAGLAEKMRLDLRRVIELSGFYECFDPMSGEGCIGGDFSWTAALWLAWAGRDAPAFQTG